MLAHRLPAGQHRGDAGRHPRRRAASAAGHDRSASSGRRRPIGFALGPALAAGCSSTGSAGQLSCGLLAVLGAVDRDGPAGRPSGRARSARRSSRTAGSCDLAFGAVRSVLADPVVRRIFLIFGVSFLATQMSPAVPAGPRRGAGRDRAGAGLGDRAGDGHRGPRRRRSSSPFGGVARRPDRVPAGARRRRWPAAAIVLLSACRWCRPSVSSPSLAVGLAAATATSARWSSACSRPRSPPERRSATLNLVYLPLYAAGIIGPALGAIVVASVGLDGPVPARRRRLRRSGAIGRIARRRPRPPAWPPPDAACAMSARRVPCRAVPTIGLPRPLPRARNRRPAGSADAGRARERVADPEIIEAAGLRWIHIESPRTADRDWLEEHFEFHPLDYEDVYSRNQRPKLDQYDDYVFIVLHFPLFEKETGRIVTAELDLFLGPDYLITLPNIPLPPLAAMFERYREKEELREDVFSKGSGLPALQDRRHRRRRLVPDAAQDGRQAGAPRGRHLRGPLERDRPRHLRGEAGDHQLPQDRAARSAPCCATSSGPSSATSRKSWRSTSTTSRTPPSGSGTPSRTTRRSSRASSRPTRASCRTA